MVEAHPSTPRVRAARGVVQVSAAPDGTVRACRDAEGEESAVVGRPLASLFDPGERPQVEAVLRELRRDPGPVSLLLHWPGHPPGAPALRWTFRRLPPLEDGPILATAVAPAPRAARPSAAWPGGEYLRAAFDEALDGIVICDGGRRIVDANPAFCDLVERARRSIVGDTLDVLVPSHARPGLAEDWQAFLQSGTQSGVLELHGPDGSRILEYRATAGILPDRHLLLVRDVTARERAEARVRRQAQRFESLYRVHDAAGRPGDEGRLHRIAVQALVRALDLDRGALLLLRASGLRLEASHGYGTELGAQVAGRALPADVADLPAEVGHPGEVAVEVQDGTAPLGALLLGRARPLDRDEAAFARLLAGILAFALRRRAQDQALDRERTALARSNAELAQFAYIASHDLQEPLRTVSSFIELLRRRYQGRLDPDADELIGFVTEGAKRMSDMIQDLLAYSRVDRPGQPPEPVDLGATVDEVREALGAVLERTGGTIEHGDLPTVTGYPAQLRQLFLHLLGNALKFRGTDPPRVRVEAEARGPAWRVAVHDNGIGIPSQHRERVFGMFQRLHHREEYAGTGMGLALCRKIVERHGGRIWAEAGPDGGTVVRFTLPG